MNASVELAGVRKHFRGAVALQDVSLEPRRRPPRGARAGDLAARVGAHRPGLGLDRRTDRDPARGVGRSARPVDPRPGSLLTEGVVSCRVGPGGVRAGATKRLSSAGDGT